MRISRKKKPIKPLIPFYRANERIQATEVRLLDENNANIGILSLQEALQRARDAELDLVEINPKADPPVTQILDFGAFKYQKEKEVRKQKIGSHISELKGIRLSIRIGEHDLSIRQEQSERFLDRGDKVRIEIIMRGREQGRADLGFEVVKKFITNIEAHIPLRVEQEPTRQGNKITAIIAKK